jgi:hypothetical protein
MALDTRPNLDNGKFEQFSGDELSLSGTTNIFGNLNIKSNGILNFLNGTKGDILISDNSGNVSLQSFGGANGLSRDGNNIVLGGTLTGNTIINGGFTQYCLGTQSSQLTDLYTNALDTCIGLVSTSNNQTLKLGSCGNGINTICYNNNQYSKLEFDPSDGVVAKFSGTTNALYYDKDYSSIYNARSIPDVAYVTGLINNISPSGNDGSIQFNSGGTFCSSPQLFYNSTGNSFTAGYRGGVIGENSVVLGGYSSIPNEASGNYSVAIGREVKITGNTSFAFGCRVYAYGCYSIAFGCTNCVLGEYSNAFGYNHCVLGGYSNAFGYNNDVTGDYSTSIGGNIDVSGNYSFGGGISSNVIGDFAFAYGCISCANNNNSFAFGCRACSTGQFSVSFGEHLDSSGYGSILFGGFSQACRSRSLGIGYQVCSRGNHSTAIGCTLAANDLLETVFGRYNVTGTGSQFSWNSNENLFTIGNGTDDTNRNNAFQILKNGNTTIDGDLIVCGNISGNTFSGTSGGGTPAGNDYEIQFNSGGTFTADSKLEYNPLKNAFTAGYRCGTIGENSVVLGGVDNNICYNEASGSGSTALGLRTVASGNYSIAGGSYTNAIGDSSIALGNNSCASGLRSVALGNSNDAVGEYSVSFGNQSCATGNTSIAFGAGSEAYGDYSVAFGGNAQAWGNSSTAFGGSTCAIGLASVAFGIQSCASDDGATAFGTCGNASGCRSTAFGFDTLANGCVATAFGHCTRATGDVSTAFGFDTVASGSYSTAFGNNTCALAGRSTAFGFNTCVTGAYGTAWGYNTKSTCYYSTAFGRDTLANEYYSTAWGCASQANARHSTAFGDCAIANDYNEIVLGRYNISGTGSQTSWVSSENLFTIGNGTSTTPNNAFQILKNGNTTIDGDLIVCGNISGNTFSGTSGGGEPAGSDGSIQFNSGNTFCSSPQLVYSASTNVFTVGYRCGTVGNDSVVIGGDSSFPNEGGITSIAIGRNNLSCGTTSIAIGGSNTSSSLNSIAIGSSNVANNQRAMAFGYRSRAFGQKTTSFGECTCANDLLETVFGRFNRVGTGSQSVWDSTDSLFVIGNGTNDTTRNNAFQVLKNGNTRIDGVLCSNTCSESPYHYSTTCSCSPIYCATTAYRTTGSGLRFCGGTGCGCAVDWIASSDIRFKKDVVPVTSALSKVDSLCGVCYNLCENGESDMGLIAQDVEKIEPRLVSKSKPTKEDKNKYNIDDHVYGLKYDKFAGLFVEAIKELKNQNINQQNEIKELKNQIKELMNK